MSRVGTSSPATGSGDNRDAELREIHQKMSRKIAQLTKVIYTLNTKNEDSEAKIKFIMQKHEDHLAKQSPVQITTSPPVDDALTVRLKDDNGRLETVVSQLQSQVTELKSDCSQLSVKQAESLAEIESTHQEQRSAWEAEKLSLVDEVKRTKQHSNQSRKSSDRSKELEDELRHQRELFEKDIGSLRLQNSNLKSEALSKMATVENEHHQNIG